MADVTEITLGEQKFGIRRLTIGQLLELGAIQMVGTTKSAADMDPNEAGDVFARRMAKRVIDTIAAALKRDFSEMTPEVIGDIEMTTDELNAVYTKVLVHAGLIAGEAPGSP